MTNGKKIIIVFAMIMILIMPPAGVENVLAEDNDNSAQETVLAADEYAEQQNETELQNEPETSQLPENDSSDTEANPSADYTVQADEDEIKASDEGTVEEPPAEDTSDSISKETGAVEQNESGEPEEVTEEGNDDEGKVFEPSESDYLSYDPLYIEKYANPEYVNTDGMSMDKFINVVTAAKGIATYNISRQKDFEATENNFIAGMNYEMPVYDIDESSRYYVTIPDVNKFNSDFKAYDLMLAYNNDMAETISGWKYDRGILYIPKTAIDKPRNKYPAASGALIAVQLNYAIGGDVDYSKTIPVQILSNSEPVNKKIKAGNLFDADSLTVSTGVRGRKSEDISVFLNGSLIPVNSDAWSYSKSNGKLTITAMPGIVSNINIVFQSQDVIDKARERLENAAETTLSSLNAYAATTSDMHVLHNPDGQEVTLRIDSSGMFVGWRGHYSSQVIHNNKVSSFNDLKGWRNSVSYLYGGYTSMSGADMSTSSDKEIDSGLAPLWAISSFAVGADLGLAENTDNIQFDTPVKHYVTSSVTETHTMYEWLMKYRNDLEKSKLVYANEREDGSTNPNGGIGNGIAGANNFALQFPTGVKGSSKSLAPGARANPDFTFDTDQMDGSYWFCAGCSELDDAAASDADSDIYVTCLDMNEADKYIVFAFSQARSGQNATAIYKFRMQETGGYVAIEKTSDNPDRTSGLTGLYSLAGAVYGIYSDSSCRQPAKDAGGNEIRLTTDASGKTAKVKVSPGTYYAREISASKGYELDPAVHEISVSSVNDENNPAIIRSVEKHAFGIFNVTLCKQSDDFGYKRLLGAEYTLKYYDTDPDTKDVSGLTPAKTWVFRTKEGEDSSHKRSAIIDFSNDDPVSGGSMYKEGGNAVLPVGVFTLKETKAPRGLAIDPEIYMGKVKQPENGKPAVTYIEGRDNLNVFYKDRFELVNNEIKRSIRLRLHKKDADTGKSEAQCSGREYCAGSLAGARYEVYMHDPTVLSDPKVGEIVTDENGYGELETDAHDQDKPLDPGTYYIKETEASPGYVLDSLTTEDEDGAYSKGRHIVDARTDDESDTIVFDYDVESLESPHHTLIHKTDVTDSSELEGARLQVIDSAGNIVDEWSSMKQPHDIVALHEGKYVLREITAPYGYDIEEDVSFEVVKDKVENEVHMENRPLKIATTASDASTGNNFGSFDSEEKIRDEVRLSGLYKGREYRVTGTLMDKATGEPFRNAAGKAISAEKVFSATGEEMTVELEFIVDSSGFKDGTAAVVFEKLYRTSTVTDSEEELPIELQKHEDLEDEGQTIHYLKTPAIQTTADVAGTGEKITTASDAVTIRDTVSYVNLIPGKTYKLRATVNYKGKADQKLYTISQEGQAVTGETEFTPEESSGTQTVSLTVDVSYLKGNRLVVFEELYEGNTIIADHSDIESEEQSVYVPEIGTKIGTKKGDTVTDKVSYTNLIPGRKYRIKGYFVRKSDGKRIERSDGQKEFVPEKPDGSVEVELKPGKEGTKLVAFESVYLLKSTEDVNSEDKEAEILVGEHNDINDSAQTFSPVRSPKTGDNNMLKVYVIVMLIASFAMGILHFRRRSGI